MNERRYNKGQSKYVGFLPKYGRANFGEGSLLLLLLAAMCACKRAMIQSNATAPAIGPNVDFFLTIQARSGSAIAVI